MAEPTDHEITGLLQAWTAGDQEALAKLTPIVYEQLRRAARQRVARKRPGNLLQTTALVNEVYLRLIDCGRVRWQDRAHFFAVSSELMRRILVDQARSGGRQKRGGGVHAKSLDEVAAVGL